MHPAVFLKLGGALITDKTALEAPREEVIARLAAEIAHWTAASQEPLVLTHGSGSFAHVAARDTDFLTHGDDPLRLALVAAAARRLNTLVVEALLDRGVPAVTVPGGALAHCSGGEVSEVRSSIMLDALRSGLVPVTYGDAVPDTKLGGTIASTEALLAALARDMHPVRVVLATDVDGVYPADPHAEPDLQPLEHIDASGHVDELIGRAGARRGATDVTGGMAGKLRLMIQLARDLPGLEIRVLSGLRPGAVAAGLSGDAGAGGTVIAAL